MSETTAQGNTSPEVTAILRELGLVSSRLATPEAVQTAGKVLSKLHDHGKALAWFKKINPMLGASPVEMIRMGRGAQLANYLDATIQ